MLSTGEVFAGYTIERQLGRGGMGSVYLAQHPRLPRKTALKLLNRELFDDKEIRARFEREADLVSQLEHANIVTVYDRGVENNQLWISMQYVDGVDAAHLDPLTLDPRRAVQIAAETAAALDYAGGAGVLHRDVKPANILLAKSVGGQQRVYLTDFGIARLREDNTHLTRTGTFTATLAFASPEQLTAQPMDSRSDQYSLACTLYFLLAGQAPFDSPQPGNIIRGHLQQDPPAVSTHRPGLPQAVDAVLRRALAKRPVDRFPTAVEFTDAMLRALTPAAPTTRNPAPAQHSPRRSDPQPPMPADPSRARREPGGHRPADAGPPAAPREYAPYSPAPSNPASYAPPRQSGPASYAPAPQPSAQAPYAPAPQPSGPAPYQHVPRPQPAYNMSPIPHDRTPRRSSAGLIVGLCLGLVVAIAVAIGIGVAMKRDSGSGPKDFDAMAKAITAEFPYMFADVELTPSGNYKATGHKNATCETTKGSTATNKPGNNEPDMGAWLTRWTCYGTGLPIYQIYGYTDTEEVRSVVGAHATLPGRQDVNAGHTYANYEFHGEGPPRRDGLITYFDGNDDRDRYLMFTSNLYELHTIEEMRTWWTAAPLT
ncbi:serine/threonine protein kinase [Nocardia sp. NPDC057668]|uniref:serine/threonine protein kinase n=1 Tax=Nocardia sp. NPDC057668 TaxID=3346202 RepID=UPI00366BEBFF